MSENVVIAGTINCPPDDLEMVVREVATHVQPTRQEPGCMTFSIEQSATEPCVFDVNERFKDAVAFEAHDLRTKASKWWSMTRHIPRDLNIAKE